MALLNGSICITNATGTINPCLQYRIGTSCTSNTTTWQMNPCFNNLPAGNYCIQIKDICTGCDTCICVTVSQQPGFQVGATAVNGCGCTSSITVNPLTPSTCPLTSYTYQLLPGGLPQASNTFSNLCPGCYTIVVTDCNGCTATVVQCVTGASAPNVNAVVTNVSCNGVSDGSICITNATGTINPCLQYRIGTSCTSNTTTWQMNPCFNNLPAGNYCIQIKDICTGCDTCICVTVSQQPGFQVGATAVNGCGCTSSITVNPLTPSTCPLTSYTYQLLPGGLPQASNTFSNLCPGCYTIVVTDCNGCTATVVQCVTGASAPNVNAVVTNVSCNGAANGSICITNATGTINPCLQYRIGTSCTSNTTTWQMNPCFNNLPAGNYCIQIMDICTGCDTCICVTVSQQPGFQVGATVVNGCGCTSSITVNPLTPSTCPLTSYTYQLLPGGLPQASNTFTNLCPGCYTIVVTDCNGCTATVVQCVTGASAPNVNAVVTNVSCNGAANGSICITNATGTINPCLQYRIGTSCTNNTTTWQMNPCFNNLPAGNYCIQIMDICTGCDTCICVTVTQPSPIQLAATATNGCGCSNSITVNVLSPSLCPVATGFTYQLLPGGLPQASNTFTNLCPGCYTIVVTDCNGCTATVVQCVTGGSAPNVNAVVTNVSCNGVSDGSICITNATGTINPCLQYRIGTSCTSNTTTWQMNPCFNNLPAGNYCIQIMDICTGCDTCICVTVTQQPGFQVGATAVNGCGCTSSITVNPLTPSTCPLTSYTYQLLPGGLPQASNTFSNLCPGCYTIVVTDCNGCTATVVQCVTGASAPNVNAVVTNVSCNGVSDGSICITNATGTINPCLQYRIGTSCTSNTTTWQFNPCFNNLPAGNYCIQIKDICTGCDTCICVTVTQPTPIQVTATSTGACACNGSITVNATGGTPCTAVGGYTYQLLPGGLPQVSNTFNNLCTGCYTIIVTDCNGCTGSVVKCVGPCGSLTLNLTAFIQGYYMGSGQMQPVLLNQGVSSTAIVTDEITVELHDPLPPHQLVATTTSMLSSIGTANCTFNGVAQGMYYIAVKHRNSIPTWSAIPILLSSSASPTSYNFTTSASQAYGGNMVEVEPGVWAIYSGDISQDENIDLSDYSIYETDAGNFLFGYQGSDVNGDGSVDLLDATTLENNVNSFIYSIHP
jgi:hypothetical protein